MLFNSFEYFVFYLAALALCWALVGFPKLRIWILLLASYYFYVSNNHWLIVLILISTQIDYIAGIRIDSSRSPATRRWFLLLSVATNLGILGFFKYYGFFAETVVDMAAVVGLRLSWTDLNIILPVGISFYTFQSMSYTIDVYRRHIPAERSWSRFAFYVAYFPQLIAGPIMRASQFLPQVPKKPAMTPARFESALVLIVMGLIKKIVLGDLLGRYADPMFNSPEGASAFQAWLGLYAFTFQIYFDFSGYSDIAIGCSSLMGYDLPDNFRRPYMAVSFSDFWKRWHISLSSWLRDYLYIPLGGNRMKTRFGTYRNLMLTMLLGGLWHGAAWHFVLWGFLHGGYLAVEKMVGSAAVTTASYRSRKSLFLKRIMVFHAVVLTWLVFRCEDMTALGHYLTALIRFEPVDGVTVGMLACAGVILFGWAAQWINEIASIPERFQAMPVVLKGAIYAAAVVLIMVFNFDGPRPFIYFRF